MKRLIISIPIIFLSAVSLFSEVDIGASAAVQATKKSSPATTANVDNTFVRAEVKAAGKTENNLSGLVQLRAQADMGSGSVEFTIRQAYFQLPVSAVNLRAGRWYEIYTVGAYFGRYLFGVSPQGSGSMCVNYNVLDGLKLEVPLIKDYNTNLHFGLLANEATLEDVYVMARIYSNPIEMLTMNLGANIQAASSSDTETHRLIFNATYKIIENLNLFAEYGITGLSDIADNSWILAGLDVPTGGILDQCRVEIEFKKDRLGEETDGDLGWMIILVKNYSKLKFNLNVGADPASLGSEAPKDVGVHFRVTATF